MADRTVTTRLVAKVTQYVGGMRDSGKATKGVTEELVDAAKAGKAMGAASESAAAKAAAAFKVAQSSAAKLDRQIDETAASVRDLAREIAAAGDADDLTKLTEKLKVERGKHRDLVDLRKTIDVGDMVDMGSIDDAAVSISARMGPVIVRALPSALASGGGVGIAVGAPIIAGLTTALASAGAGAAIGAAAGGAVAVGIKIAAKNPAVAAAGKSLSDSIGSQMKDAAAPFVPATLGAISIVRDAFGDIDGDLKGIFARASGYVRPFANAAANAVREIAPGFRDAVDAAEPVVRMLEQEIPELAGDIADAFSGLSEHAEEGAAALGFLFDAIGLGIRTVAGVIGTFAEVFKWADVLAQAMGGNWAGVVKYAGGAEEATNSSSAFAEMLNKLGQESSAATVEIRALSDILDEITGKNLSLVEAQVAAEQAIDDATAAIKENGKNVNDNTAKGRENISALTGMAQAFNRETEAAEASGQTAAQGAALHKRHADALYAAAIAAGKTEKEARDLVAQWLKVPKGVHTKVTEKGSAAVRAAIASIPNRKDVHVAMRLTGYANVSGTIAALRKNQRWGGVHVHAQDGLLRSAHIASPSGPARYAYAEPATGGEAFIPRKGDMARSRAIWEYVGKNWLRARPAPPQYVMAGGGGGNSTVSMDVTLRWPDGQVAARIVETGFRADRRALSGLIAGISNAGGDPRPLNL